MKPVNQFKRFKLIIMYCLPAILACGLLVSSYYGRVLDIGQNIFLECAATKSNECVIIESVDCETVRSKFISSGISQKDQEQVAHENDLRTTSKICEYHEQFSKKVGFVLTNGERVSGDESVITARKYVEKINENTEKILTKDIFALNAVTISILVLLPFYLMGDVLAKSTRFNLSYEQRLDHSNANWWLKFLVALIIAVGLTYILNPLGRGASTYYQFFIATGLDNTDTLPIYIKSGPMTPVLAGFFGWFLHLIGYIFTKLIHHDVVSARVYNLLFKKFIVTYGIALVIPETGFIDDVNNAAFFMFLIGLFPLTAMSMLIESLSKLGSGDKKADGNLSQLPGISRWQILRLEEEGVDSMAALASIPEKTISENLQMMDKLTVFWADIARLYTVVGHDAYPNLKGHCLTASEFIKKSEGPTFAEVVRNIEGVSESDEIARILKETFDPLKLA